MILSFDLTLANSFAVFVRNISSISSNRTRVSSLPSSPRQVLCFIYKLQRKPVRKQLNVDVQEVEELLIGLILEGKVEGRIDQVGMRLELETKLVFLHSRLS